MENNSSIVATTNQTGATNDSNQCPPPPPTDYKEIGPWLIVKLSYENEKVKSELEKAKKYIPSQWTVYDILGRCIVWLILLSIAAYIGWYFGIDHGIKTEKEKPIIPFVEVQIQYEPTQNKMNLSLVEGDQTIMNFETTDFSIIKWEKGRLVCDGRVTNNELIVTYEAKGNVTEMLYIALNEKQASSIIRSVRGRTVPVYLYNKKR